MGGSGEAAESGLGLRGAEEAVPRGFLERLRAEELAAWIERLQSFGTRYAYTDRAGEAAEYLLTELSAMGLSASLQSFTYNGHTMSNVLATIPGRDPSLPAYVLGAHYDSINGTDSFMNPYAPAPGADDDASGAAAVLGAARALSRAGTNRTVVLALFAGEEVGRVGSSEFVRRAAAEGSRVAGAICLDMIGYNHRVPWVDVVSDESSLWIFDAVRRANYFSGVGLRTGLVVTNRTPERWSDHVSFWEGGLSAICLIESENPTQDGRYFEANPYYHSAGDTLDKLNISLVERVGRLGLATLASLAGLALPDIRPVLMSAPRLALEGDDVRLEVSLENSGESVESSSVALIVDGAEIQRRERNVGSGRATLCWTAVAGAHTIRVSADPGDELAEWSEGNNAIELKLFVSGRPDLCVSELRASDPSPVPGQPIHMLVEVVNLGGAHASARVSLAPLGGEPLLDEPIFVPVGGSAAVSAGLRAPDGPTTYTAIVSDASPWELESSNNELSLELTPHALDTRGSALRANPDVVNPGELVELELEPGPGLLPPLELFIDFGDGSVAGWLEAFRAPHVYNRPGVYVASALVRDALGAEASVEPATVTVRGLAPIAIVAGPEELGVGETGVFSGALSRDPDGRIVRYIWEFEDGGRALGESASHAFMDPGSYQVRLTVSDDDGVPGVGELFVNVTNSPPIARVEAGARVLLLGELLSLNGSGSSDPDGKVVRWEWGLGDGAALEGEAVEHAYSAPGRYIVELTVTDDLGAIGMVEIFVSVFERPAPPPPRGAATPPYLAPAAALVMILLGGALISCEALPGRRRSDGASRPPEE